VKDAAPPRILDPRAPFALPLVLLVASRGWFWRLIPFASEDAYITFRYARSWVRGLGPVFNEGERVLGTTSPLWMAWSALGIALAKDPVLWARVTTVGLELLALVLITREILKAYGQLSAWAFALFYAAWPFFAANAVNGLEVSALFALLGLAAVAAARRRWWAGPLIGLLPLLRPEGLVLAAAVAVIANNRARITGAVVALAGAAAIAAYYGSPVPQSLIAKAAVYGTPGPWYGRHWWEWIVPFALGRWPATSEGSELFTLTVVTAPALVAGAVRLLHDRRRAAAPFAIAAGCLLVWLGYAAFGVTYFEWYFVLPLGALAVCAAVGLPRVTRGPWVPAAVALYVLGTWTILPGRYFARALIENSSFGAAGQMLRLNSTPGQSVLLEPIGMIGYSCRLRVIDEIGLVSPAVAERRKQGDGWMADVIAHERPDWLITRRGILEGANSGAAYAGRGRPFRDDAERVRTLAVYSPLAIIEPAAGDQALEIRGLHVPVHPVLLPAPQR
jgi:hypothetical protein